MLVSWMLYSVAVGAIAAGGALALDKVAEIWNTRRRAIWLAGLAATLVLPAAALVAPAVAPASPAASAPAPGVERRSFRVVSAASTPTLMMRMRARSRSAVSSAALNRHAWQAWLACSFVLFSAFLIGALRLRRLRSRWSAAVVDGHDVSISQDIGPAVVGTLHPRIVLPSWALSLDALERELMLRHEAEHVRARDPLVLAVAALAATCIPWNPFVWFFVRRLRLALEIDCDARVLARDARADAYGGLLLTVGARSSGALRFTASLAEPRSFLERRIVAMTMHRPAHPFAASLPFILISAAAAVAAAQTPRPARDSQPTSAPTVRAVPAVPAAASVPTVAPAAVVAPAVRAAATTPAVAPVVSPAPVRGDLSALLAALATVASLTPTASTAPSVATVPSADIPVEVLREWIQQHHPNVIAGDPSVNQVVIVVDANEQYLRSYARFDSTPAMGAGAMRGRVGGGGAGAASAGGGRAGRGYTGDTVQLSFLMGSLPTERPLFIVDGVVVNGIDGIERDRIQSVEVIKGAAAIAQYGPAASRGVIVIDTKSQDLLSSMNIDADQIQNIDVLKLSPGMIGPKQLRVIVVQLKDGV